MRYTTAILMLIPATLILGGCASHPASVSMRQQGMSVAELNAVDRSYSPTSAAALAFDPPVLAGTPRLDLSRDGRDTTAFVGYQEINTTTSVTRIDDWQRIHQDNLRYDREAASETTSVIDR